jgi:hypothetical protein
MGMRAHNKMGKVHAQIFLAGILASFDRFTRRKERLDMLSKS